MCVFLWLLQGYLLVCFHQFYYDVPSYGFLYIYPAFGFLSFLVRYIYFLTRFVDFGHISFNMFFFPHSSSPFGNPVVWNLDPFMFCYSEMLFTLSICFTVSQIGYFLLLCFQIHWFFSFLFSFPLSNLLLSSLRHIFPF